MPTDPHRESLEGDREIGYRSSEFPQQGDDQPGAAPRRGPTGLKMPDGTEPRSAAFRRIARLLGPYRTLRRAAREELVRLPEPASCSSLPDSQAIFRDVEGICETPHRRAGSDHGHRAEEYIAERFREVGLCDVTKDPIDINLWDAHHWKFLIHSNGEAINFPSFYVVNTGFTGPEGVQGEMVYVGTGTARDFAKVDVQGKVVVAEIPFPTLPLGLLTRVLGGGFYTSDPQGGLRLSSRHTLAFARPNFPNQYGEEINPKSVYWMAQRLGARALVLILENHPGDTNRHYGPYDGVMKPMPALYVSGYQGDRLRSLVRSGARATVVLEGSVEPGVTSNVWGLLPGQSPETILVSTHHDAPFRGATEDGTGVAQVLAQATAWSSVPKHLRRRTLLFVITTGHLYRGIGAATFCHRHRDDLMRQAIININLEHLCAGDVDDRGGCLVPNGRVAWTPMFVSSAAPAIATAMRSVQRHRPPSTTVLPSTLLGEVPPGEAGHYHIHTGVEFIHWIGSPYYLLTDEDTLDKVECDQLAPTARLVAEMVGTYLEMPLRG
jgi:hypothetical protein